MGDSICTQCKSNSSKYLTEYSWFNGVLQVTKYYCEKCEKKYAPPKKQIRLQGGTVVKIKSAYGEIV